MPSMAHLGISAHLGPGNVIFDGINLRIISQRRLLYTCLRGAEVARGQQNLADKMKNCTFT